MGIDLLAVFKTSAENLSGLEWSDLLNEIGILPESLGPFGLSLSYFDSSTKKHTLIHRSGIIPLENIEQKIKIAGNNPLFFNLWLNHGMEYDTDGKISPNLKLLIEKSKVLYKLTKPQFGFCGYDLGFEPYYWHFTDCIMWLNFFGSELVKKYGRNKLLSVPAYAIEELPDGGIFMQASIGPGRSCFPTKEEIETRKLTNEELDFYDESAQVAKIGEHLGVEMRKEIREYWAKLKARRETMKK